MQAGRLRHYVTIQRRVEGSPQRTASGAPDEAWATFCTGYADIAPLRGKEFFESQAINSAVTVRIRMRYRAGVEATMRVLHGSTVYSIEALIVPGVRLEEMQLMCSQGANNG